MRVTLDPGGDVLLPTGLTLADLRPRLARLTGDDTWRTAPLAVDGRPLPEDHVAGVPPWVAGTSLTTAPRTSPARAPDPTRAPWRLAVLDGPDAGSVVGPDAQDHVLLGRATHPGNGPPRARRRTGPPPRTRGRARRSPTLALGDPLVSRSHAAVQRRRGRWALRDLRSANGTVHVTGATHRTPGRETALRWRPRRLVPGDAVRLGASLLVLEGPEPRRSRWAEALHAARHPSVLVMLLGALAVAALTRNPMFLAFGLLAPLSALATRLTGDHRPDPAGTSAPPAPPDGTSPTDPLATLPRVGVTPLLVDPRRARAASPDPEPPAWWALARDGLAVVGPGADGVARTLLLDALGAGRLSLLIGTGGWEWLRWAEAPLASTTGVRVARTAGEVDTVLADPPESPHLLLDVAGEAWRPATHRWFGGRRPEDAVVVVSPDEDPPAWCTWTLRATDGTDPVLSGPATDRTVIAPALSTTVAEAVARSRAPGWAATGDAVPDRVGWADLGLPTSTDDVLGTWARATQGPAELVAQIGLGPNGRPVTVDLRRDGPHALVAGTTGAGKSELLQTLLLALATTHPPDEVAMLLVDYKGGAGFGECARLPHVVGLVTDLDEAGSTRALAALRTELRRREHLLAKAGVTDLDALRRAAGAGGPAGPGGTGGTGTVPPRLLVVVDEFRALVEDLPDLVAGLVRIATQGRSLGVHLVLATQRPAGVVDAQLRANLPLRLCLRVADRADSLDVVERPDAAEIPAGRPGRALLHRAGGVAEPVQTAWAALPSGKVDAVRWAPGWSALGPSSSRTAPPDPDAVARLVDAVGEAHRRTGRPAPEAPWLPPLAPLIGTDQLPDGPSGPDGAGRPDGAGGPDVADGPESPAGLPLALGDRPEHRRQDVVTWDPDGGALLVAGGPVSGRTTTLRTAAHAALRAGWHVHVIATGRHADWLGDAPAAGTFVGPAEPGRTARLLDRLLLGVPARTLVVVDDIGAVQQSLGLLPRGVAEGLLDRVVREGRLRALAVAAAGTPSDLVRHLPHAALRLVLPLADPHDARLLGATRPASRTPGRALALGAGDGDLVCQVAVSPGPPVATARPAARPVRLRPLSPVVGDPDPAVLGRGGDDAGPVPVPTGPVLVVGPSRSGRSTALDRIARAHRAAGRTVRDVGGKAGGAYRGGLAAPAADVVVLDDLDLRLRADPALDDLVAEWVVGGRCVVLASARTDRVASAYRGALATLRETTTLLLDPAHPGSGDAAGTDLALHADPTARVPGRGVLVVAGTVTPVQVAR